MVDLTVLHDEFVNDPLGLGYAEPLSQSDDFELASLINSTSGPGANVVYLTSVTLQTFMGCVQSTTDWDLIVAPGNLFNSVQLLTLVQPLDCSKPNIQILLHYIMNLGPLSAETQQAMLEACARLGSRAEILFGINTVVTTDDCANAR